MDQKQNPFSVYDFLGYLIPGAIFLYILYLGNPFLGIGWRKLLPEYPLLFRHPDAYIPFVIGAYLLGHGLSFLSSVLVEHYAIWIFGYPSQFLIGIHPTSYFSSIPDNKLAARRRKLRKLFWLAGFPFTSLDFILEHFLKIRQLYAKPLDKHLINLIKRKLWIFVGWETGIFRSQYEQKKKVSGNVPIGSIDYFRSVYHYVIENYPAHIASIKNYVALYGFLRTITFIMTMLFWLGVVKMGFVIYRLMNCQTPIESIDWMKFNFITVFIAITWIASYVFFMAFAKFHRRYSLEVLMALASNYDVLPPTKAKDPFCEYFLEPRVPSQVVPNTNPPQVPSATVLGSGTPATVLPAEKSPQSR